MGIRKQASEWYMRKRGTAPTNFHCSKLFNADESFTKRRAWWFSIPLDKLTDSSVITIDLLCATNVESDEFTHLQVPTLWLNQNLAHFVVRNAQTVELWLSAETNDYLDDVRQRDDGLRLSFEHFVAP